MFYRRFVQLVSQAEASNLRAWPLQDRRYGLAARRGAAFLTEAGAFALPQVVATSRPAVVDLLASLQEALMMSQTMRSMTLMTMKWFTLKRQVYLCSALLDQFESAIEASACPTVLFESNVIELQCNEMHLRMQPMPDIYDTSFTRRLCHVHDEFAR